MGIAVLERNYPVLLITNGFLRNTSQFIFSVDPLAVSPNKCIPDWYLSIDSHCSQGPLNLQAFLCGICDITSVPHSTVTLLSRANLADMKILPWQRIREIGWQEREHCRQRLWQELINWLRWPQIIWDRLYSGREMLCDQHQNIAMG